MGDKDSTQSAGDSRELLLRVFGEYMLKGMVVLTGCIMVGYAVIVFLKQGNVTIEQVIIIAGFGYMGASKTLFPGKDPKEKAAKR